MIKMKYTAIILFILLVIPLIQSAGVATSYWDTNPLKLAPGESTTISVRLQNSETDSVILRASLESTLVSLVDGSDYTVIKGASVPVNLKVTIPPDAPVGTKYDVLINFQELSSGEGGMLRVATGVTTKLPIEVVGLDDSALRKETGITGEVTSGKGSTISYLIGGVLLVIVLIIIFVIKKNRNAPKQNSKKPSS